MAFATPEVERLVEVGGRVAVIERRLPGTPFSQALSEAQGAERQQLLLSYLEAASQIGDIAIKRDFFGDLGSERAIRRPSYRDYLQARLEMTRSLPGPLSHLPITDLDGIPDCSSGTFVHFDFFPGNVLVEAGRVTAVIDFGATSMIADRRLDCWSAVAYLDAELAPEANLEDRALALHWLEQRGFGAEFAAAKRWIASYWCFAFDDPKVSAWCSRVLAP
nr:phosphotransferase [Devosia sp. Root413D1]